MRIPSPWLKSIKNVLFCIEGDSVSFDDLIQGKYDEQLMIHMDVTATEIRELLPHHHDYIKHQIILENESRKIMFG
jgi:hypothetical protein